MNWNFPFRNRAALDMMRRSKSKTEDTVASGMKLGKGSYLQLGIMLLYL